MSELCERMPGKRAPANRTAMGSGGRRPREAMSPTSVSLSAAHDAGVVSFLSPYVLPIVPGYLSMITGLDVAEIQTGGRRYLSRIARDTSLFIAGVQRRVHPLGAHSTSIDGTALPNHLLLNPRLGCRRAGHGPVPRGIAGTALTVVAPGAPLPPEPVAPWPPPPGACRPAAFAFGWTPCLRPCSARCRWLPPPRAGPGGDGAVLGVYSAGLGRLVRPG